MTEQPADAAGKPPASVDATQPIPVDATPPAPRERATPEGDGLDPTRYGDWEKNGRCIDF